MNNQYEASIIKETANVLDKPNGKSVATLNEGEVITFVKLDKGGFAEVLYGEDKKKGYVRNNEFRKFSVTAVPVETTPTEPEEPTEVPKIRTPKQQQAKKTLIFDYIDKNPHLKAVYEAEQQRKANSVEENFKRSTFYVRRDLLWKFNQIADVASRQMRGTKKGLINEILEKYIKELEEAGFPFVEYNHEEHKDLV